MPKQEYTAEFKKLAAKQVESGQTSGAVAKGLGLIEQMLCDWIKTTDADKLNRVGTKSITDLLDYIESFYNRKRRHSALSSRSPAESLKDWISAQHDEKLVA